MTEVTETLGNGDSLGFDHWSSKMTYAPWDVWARLRNECPVAHTQNHGGYYVLSRYDDVFAAALDTSVFSSDGDGKGVGIPPQEMSLFPVDLDPPFHTPYRSMLNPWLSPRSVAKLEPWIRAVDKEYLEKLPRSGIVDVAEAFTLVTPRLVAFHVLGFPREEMDEIGGYIEQMATTTDRETAGAALSGKLIETIERRRSSPRKSDILDAVVYGEIDGRPLDDAQIMGTLALLLFGGLGTTSAALGGMVLWLADHPEDWQRLRDRPELHQTAIDEFVRWTSPVAHIGRTLTADVELHGCPMKSGERVSLAYGSANRDPDHFDRPDEVLIDRHPNRHIAFGMGPHRCIGSHLARLQLQVALEEILLSWPSVRVADYGGIRWAPGETRFICNLPIEIRGSE